MTPGLEIVPYDPAWPAAFGAEASRIRRVLGAMALRIDHHGSTAVPGLAAKPIIDIQVSVASLQPLTAFVAPLATIGYTHVPHPDDAICPFFHRPVEWPHTHHVHVVAAGSEEERRTLAFRDYLREHADAAGEYGRLKQDLAARLIGADAESREEYARAKTGFVQRIVAAAYNARVMRTLVSSGSPYEPKVGISRAVRASTFVTVAGTAPLGADGRTVGRGDAATQARRCLDIIAAALEGAGASLRHVVRTRILLTRIDDWEAVAAVHGEVFRDIRPANTVMQVVRFIDPEWLVEIEADAVVDDEGGVSHD
jgi:GrpB-like predicted nucleotidyltransferase (UPF0157 family)/enamine deaminase RidA (YjgF/YER057c/UK114 family)